MSNRGSTPPEQLTPDGLRALAKWAAHVPFVKAPTQDELNAFADAWEAEREQYGLLAKAVNENSGECTPGCDSYGHTPACTYVDMGATLVLMQKRIETLERALAACKPIGKEFCKWCWSMPPHKPGCPIAKAAQRGDDA